MFLMIIVALAAWLAGYATCMAFMYEPLRRDFFALLNDRRFGASEWMQPMRHFVIPSLVSEEVYYSAEEFLASLDDDGDHYGDRRD